MAGCQRSKLHAPCSEEGVRADEKRVGPFAGKRRESRIDLPAGADVEGLDLQSHRASRRFHLLPVRLRARRIGGIDEARQRGSCRGTSSRRSSSRFGTSSPMTRLTPVRLPPGRERLATSPSLTGSSGTVNTIGMVVVAALAARAGAVPPCARMTVTCLRTRSAASPGSRSSWFSAQRYSIATFSPSTYPASFKPWRNPRRRSAKPSGDTAPRKPITGIVGCCARAASGHAAAAPPSSDDELAPACSFDHLVGAGEQRLRHLEAERLGRLAG